MYGLAYLLMQIIGASTAWRRAIYCVWISKLRSTGGKKQFSEWNSIARSSSLSDFCFKEEEENQTSPENSYEAKECLLL